MNRRVKTDTIINSFYSRGLMFRITIYENNIKQYYGYWNESYGMILYPFNFLRSIKFQ